MSAHTQPIAGTWRAGYCHVSPALRCVICAIPKNANRTVKRFLLAAEGIDTAALSDPEMHALCRERLALALRDDPEQQRLLDTYTTVIVLRDPLERLVSAFADRVVRVERAELNRPMFEAIHAPGHPASVGVTFTEFVGYLARTPSRHLDHHWKPQADFAGGHPFDRACLIADVDALLGSLARERGIPHARPAATERRATRPWTGSSLADVPSGELRRQGILPGVAALCTPETEALIRTRYGADLALIKRSLPTAAA